VPHYHGIPPNGGYAAAGHPDDKHTALGREGSEGIGEPVPAHWVQDQIDAPSVCGFPGGLEESIDTEDNMGAGAGGGGSLGLSGRHRDHVRPACGSQLDGREADAAGGPVNQHCFTGLEPSTSQQCEMRRKQVHRERSALGQVEVFRQGKDHVGIHSDLFGESAVAAIGHDPFARMEAGTLWCRDQDAGDLAAKHEGQFVPDLVLTACL
jgi:hypothetical protein